MQHTTKLPIFKDLRSEDTGEVEANPPDADCEVGFPSSTDLSTPKTAVAAEVTSVVGVEANITRTWRIKMRGTVRV